MTNTIHKILLIPLFVIFWIYDSNGQTAIHRDTTRIDALKPRTISPIQESKLHRDSLLLIMEPLIGCFCDPDFRNVLVISLMGSLKSPNAGLGLNFNPLYSGKLEADVLYRNVLHNDFIFNTKLETKYLFDKLPLDFTIAYNYYNLLNAPLNDYHNFLIGTIYRIPWSSIGLLMGQDNYETKNNVGYEMFLNYTLHKKTGQFADISSNISYWRNTINYKVQCDYRLNYNISIGIGYQKIYDFDEIFFTFRYAKRY